LEREARGGEYFKYGERREREVVELTADAGNIDLLIFPFDTAPLVGPSAQSLKPR
jgi:hypothetical protein